MRGRRSLILRVGADAHIGPLGSHEFAVDYRKNGAFRRADVGIGPYKSYSDSVGNFELLQITRERSKKTEAVFLGALKGAPGGNRNPPGLVFFCQRFLLEKQKKMLVSSCKFLKRVPALAGVSSTTQKRCGFAEGFQLLTLPVATSQALRASSPFSGTFFTPI